MNSTKHFWYRRLLRFIVHADFLLDTLDKNMNLFTTCPGRGVS